MNVDKALRFSVVLTPGSDTESASMLPNNSGLSSGAGADVLGSVFTVAALYSFTSLVPFVVNLRHPPGTHDA